MRRVTVASCLLAVTWCMTLSACSSSDSDHADAKAATPTGEIRLTLQAEGADATSLKIDGVPADAHYIGIYPNPQRWDSVEFTLGRDGIPVTRCVRDGIAKPCSETPFFVEVKRNVAAPAAGSVAVRTTGVPAPSGSSEPAPPDSSAGTSDTGAPPPSASSAPPSAPPADTGGSVDVYDTTGKKVATVPIGGAPAPSSGGAGAPAGSTCGGAAVGGAPGTGGFSKNGTTGACEAASLADTPGCDGSTVAAAAKVYCDAVNAQLGAGQKIDCSVLTNPDYAPSALPSSRTGGDCSTYWEPARDAVTAGGFGACQKVSLLLTQWRDRSRHELISHGVCTSSPLILDLDGDGIHLSSLENGVKFDLLGVGQKVFSAWTDGKDALLALDRDGNGQIDGASELFGNATGGATYEDGFAALAQLDEDGNGAIDSRDTAFKYLLLWRDANRDGVSTPAELTTLGEAGVRRLAVSAVRRGGPSSLDVHGNSIPLVADFERRDGTRGQLVDAFLRYRPLR
jgi:hypothetical protein